MGHYKKNGKKVFGAACLLSFFSIVLACSIAFVIYGTVYHEEEVVINDVYHIQVEDRSGHVFTVKTNNGTVKDVVDMEYYSGTSTLICTREYSYELWAAFGALVGVLDILCAVCIFSIIIAKVDFDSGEWVADPPVSKKRFEKEFGKMIRSLLKKRSEEERKCILDQMVENIDEGAGCCPFNCVDQDGAYTGYWYDRCSDHYHEEYPRDDCLAIIDGLREEK